METQQAILLGAVQGLTEFLPVSSSGHLVLAQEVLGMAAEEEVAVAVLVHLGSLLAIIGFFWRDLLGLFYPKIHLPRLGVLLLASVPAGVIGLLLSKYGEAALASPWLACIGLLITSGLLASTHFWRRSDDAIDQPSPPSLESPNRKTWRTAIIVGMAQGLAVLPGVSRSGSTITAALHCGWSRADALRLSFLMGMIAIGGAGLLKARDISELNAGPALAAFGSSLVFSLIGLSLIKLVVKRAKLHWFAVYTAIVGIGGLIWLSFRG